MKKRALRFTLLTLTALVGAPGFSHGGDLQDVETNVEAFVSAPTQPAVTVENLLVVGMKPTEITEFTFLPVDEGEPLAAVMAKAVTTAGATMLDEVLQTRHSVGIYRYQSALNRWIPMWERLTGELSVAFVEGYEVIDVNGDGREDLCVRLRYTGPERVLDFLVKTVEDGRVNDLFKRTSLYQGSATASTGYIVVEQPEREDKSFQKREVYAWDDAEGRFQLIREVRSRRHE